MKILSAAQLYEAYNQTIEKQGISALDILERAGVQIFNWMHMRMQGAQVKIHIFNGIGNNGGVGLILARHLLQHGYNVDNYVVNYSKKRTEGFLVNYDKVKEIKEWPEMIKSKADFPEIDPNDIVVDAIFGIGLNRETSEYVKDLIQYLNAQKAFKLSIDIPSGLYSNKYPLDRENIIYSNYTLSFQSPKLVFFLPETAKFTEQWEVLDIGLDMEYMYQVEAKANLVSKEVVMPVYQPRIKFSSKFDYGHALIVGGSEGKMGSVALASRAALVSGCGLVSCYVPKNGNPIMQSSFPEAMVQTSNHDTMISNITPEGQFQVVAIGCGMGTSEETTKGFEAFIKSNKLPLVLDADAINIIGGNNSFLEFIPKGSVLTPHKAELKRLIGEWSDDFDMLGKVKVFSATHDLIMVIKDAITFVIYHNRMFVNSTGNPGLATAGSGDCLTGIIAGLIAQGYESLPAAIFGCYLHGKTADIGILETGYQSFIASDVIKNLPKAYMDLFKQPEQPQQQEDGQA